MHSITTAHDYTIPEDSGVVVSADGNSVTGKENNNQRRTRSPSKHVWTEVRDSATGRMYYYNPVTKEVTWTHPSEHRKSMARLSGMFQNVSVDSGTAPAPAVDDDDEPVVVLTAASEMEADMVYARTVAKQTGTEPAFTTALSPPPVQQTETASSDGDAESDSSDDSDDESTGDEVHSGEFRDTEAESADPSAISGPVVVAAAIAAVAREDDSSEGDVSSSDDDDDDDDNNNNNNNNNDDDNENTSSGTLSASTPVSPSSAGVSSTTASEATPVSTTTAVKKKKGKPKEKRAVQIYEQFRALLRRHPAEEGKTLGEVTVKDKFIIIHLSFLTQVVEDEEGNKFQGFARPPETKPMETELRGYLHLRSAFRGDLADVLTALEHTYNECINIVLPTSRLNMLHLAVASGHAKLVKHLCDQFPEMVDDTANNGLTPLMISCLFGLHEITAILLEKGADVNAQCTAIPYARAGSPFRTAVQYWSNTIFKGQNSLGVMTPLLYAIFSGCPQTVLVLHSQTNSVSSSSVPEPQQLKSNLAKFTTDPLTLASVQQVSRQIFQLLLNERKMDVNFGDINGVTPLIMCSMCNGSGHVCSQLTAQGANINLVDSRNGNTALHYAIIGGYRDFIKQLCRTKKGTEELAVNINHNNPKQQLTPLQLATRVPNMSDETRKKIISTLKKYGAMERRLYSEVLKEGYLTKEGHFVKNWKTRWFILKQDTMYYYKSIQRLKKPRGSICIRGAIIQSEPSKKRHCFSIHDVVNDKKFYMIAPSEREKQEWIDACEFAIRSVKEQSTAEQEQEQDHEQQQ